jgi:hypothetical protein
MMVLGAGYAETLLEDWERRDDLQNVTLTNVVTSVSYAGLKAKNRDLTYKEVMLGAALGLEPTDQMWIVGAKRLVGVTPHRGDTITTTDGTVWTALSIKVKSFGDTLTHFEIIGRKQ